MRKDIEMMGTKEKVLALLAVLVVFGQVYAAEEAKDGPPLPDVRLSAYIVKVDLEALYESGVSPVGKKPDTVSILKILSCFAQNKAEVIGGSSLFLEGDRSAATKMRKIKYRKEVIDSTYGKSDSNYKSYSTVISFESRLKNASAGKVSLWFEFGIDTPDFSVPDTLPEIISLDFTCSISLADAVPTIAGFTQDEDSAIFLILVAEID